MPTVISGKTGTISFGATSVCVTNWDVSIPTETVDSTHTCTGGLQDNVAGITSSEITCAGPMLTGATYPAIGDVVTITLGNSLATPTTIYEGKYLVNSFAYNLAVDGKYEFTINATSTVV
jgi:hypothetical protein